MLRNPLTGFSMLFMFATITLVYVSMWLAFTVIGPAPTAVIDSTRANTIDSLEGSGVALVDAGSGDQNVEITVEHRRAHVVLDASVRPAWNPIWLGLREAGFAADAITVVDSTGDVKTDPLRANLGVAAMLGIASIAFIGTTVPLVAMRERGLLRLFGTTPLRRSTFLLAQLPARVFIAATLTAAAAAIAHWQRYLDGLDLLSFGVTFLIGTAMLLAFGLLFAARSRNAEATQQGLAMLTILLVFTSGGLLPPSLLPPVVQITMNCLPTTWLAAAAGATLTDSEPFVPLSALWALMAVATGCAAGLAARRFEWDQSESRRTTRTRQREKVQV